MPPEDNPADDVRAGRCDRCNGGGRLCRCHGCGELYRHIHKYSDCDNARCEGEGHDDVSCPDCDGSGLDGRGAP